MGQKQSFSARIETENSSRFTRGSVNIVAIPAGSTYSVRVSNHSNTRCDVALAMDAVTISTWRLNGREELLIDRDPNSNSMFRVVNGGDVLRILFKPERSWMSTTECESDRFVLQKSGDKYVEVPALDRSNVEWNAVIEIAYKLIIK